MKLVLTDSRYLKESINIISDLVNEAVFKINKDAIELIAMDPANVAMVIFKLLSSAFSEYNIKSEISLAINLNNFKQVLRRAKPSDAVTLEIDENNKLKIQLKSAGSGTRTFSLPVIDMEEKQQKIPDLKFPILVQTTSEVLNDAIEDVSIVADSVTFMAQKGVFTIKGEGDLSEAKVEVEENETTKINATDEQVKAKYSTEYLKKMIAGSKLSDQVVVQFNKDYPLKIDYRVIDTMLLSFILAPRVETE